MWRRPLVILLPVLVMTAVGARVAAGGSESVRAGSSASAVAASSTLRLPSMQRCVRRSFVRVGLIPPAGQTFASLSVRVGEDEVLQLAGLSGPGTVVVELPRGRSRVHATGTTSAGTFMSVAQSYRRCSARSQSRTPSATPAPRPKPKPKPTPTSIPPVTGGGGNS